MIKISLVVLALLFYPAASKQYTVTHTETEWSNIVQGVAYTRDIIHQSNLPAREAFWCDSALTTIQNDIYRQVIAQKQAEDTTGKKKGGRP